MSGYLEIILSQMMLGLVNGSFYALIALGLAIIVSMLGIINFAQGAFYMMGAFLAWMLNEYLGMGYWAALLAVPAAMALFGMLVGLMIGRLTAPEPRVLERVEVVAGGLNLWFNEEPQLHGEEVEGTLVLVFEASGRSQKGQLELAGKGLQLTQQAQPLWYRLAQTQVQAVLQELDDQLVGLAPVKARVRDIAALLVIDKLRAGLGLASQAPSLHMCFSGNPGTGKTTVAYRMAQILHRLGYVRKGHLVAVTRDDLVGQYIGHTAPKTREVLKKAMGGVLFIDEAYYLYRPENERDYGQEAIEILMQVMENHRDDLVVILAGYGDRMETFFQSNPGMRSRIAHHLEFPDYAADELMQIASSMLAEQNHQFSDEAAQAFERYLTLRLAQPHFANARSVRNALDRARLRQASRLFSQPDREWTAEELTTLQAPDILGSRLFQQDGERHA